MKDLAAQYPWIDLDRAGIYGHSGGGNATAAAMFHYPDFFKVGIAESGNHDNRDYEDDWAEKWAGLLVKNPDGTSNYDSQANQNTAKNLKGHLLLAHGTMDDNVPPNNTLAGCGCIDQGQQGLRSAADPQRRPRLRSRPRST
jgi:dipeptidyl-peptidase-4